MGSFRIEVQAVGGHGCDRGAKAGETLTPCGGSQCPDCAARRFIGELGQHSNVEKATFTHWPPELGQGPEIVDDLVDARRIKGSFQDAFRYETFSEDEILRFFAFEHLPPAMQAVSKPFKDIVMRMVATLPRSAERTAMLRKLLEAKDCAVRASLPKPT